MLNRLNSGLTIALLAAGLAVGCGGDDDNGGESTGGTGNRGSGGDAGETTTGGSTTGGSRTGGASGSETGGSTSGGSAGEATTGGTSSGGSAGEATTGGTSTGGTTGDDATIDDLIAAICGWEFGCCEAGERAYRLGPSSASVDRCTSDFLFQYHSSNATNNPYPPGTATGLLGTLGYTVDPSRVEESAAGIQSCIDAWEELSCASAATSSVLHCEATYIPGEGPCALVNLFAPGLAVGDRCTLALAEGDGNDVECPAGSTCLPAGDPDNPNAYPTCVQRGTDGDPCSQHTHCDWDHYCSASGNCVPKGDVGDDCSFNVPATPVPGDERAQCRAGLRCHPTDLTCVANCELDYPCSSNAECAEGNSCVPVTVGEDATTWSVCRPIGTGASDRCDDNDDCVASRRCAGGVCQADVTIGNDCTTDADCEAGSFCDTARYGSTGSTRTATYICTQFFNAGEPCFMLSASGGHNSGCNPNSAPQCAYDGDRSAWTCTTVKRPVGAACFPYVTLGFPSEPSDCARGLACEATTPTVTSEWFCSPGAALGEDCDDDVNDSDALLCGVGLFCDPTNAECVPQLDPGADCDDPNTTAVAAEPGLCKNGACVSNWDQASSVEYICTDAPVSVANDGDGLTCNGD